MKEIEMDKLSVLTFNLYSLALLAGGIMCFFKTHSKKALVIGVVSGLLIFIANKLRSNNSKAGNLYIAAISLVLAILFFIKFTATHLLMPHGLMLILSALVLFASGSGYLKGKK